MEALDAVRSAWTGVQVDRNNLVAAVGVVGILLIMVLPLPAPALDLFLALNITISILVFLLAIYVVKPLDFPIFPSLLLITTLFRLSLNIASTRLILLHGHEGFDAAGRIIMGFGHFVVGGNYVVGGIVFCILVIINFVVITKGSGRIAEVAARFTLDAMPGKQMAIDADLNTGLIDENEARKRREKIARESEFYGAMDGASKFVRGEAIAGLAIIAINVIGGFVIGVLQQDMPVASAAQSYTLLTIGDGLVSQIPALVISTAAGILVSRAASNAGMGTEFIRQFARHPQALAVTCCIVFIFGMIPGLPAVPFTVLAIGIGVLAYVAFREEMKNKRALEAEAAAIQEPEEAAPGTPEEVERLLQLDILELKVGYGLIPLVDEGQGGDLLERIKSIRRKFAREMGIIVPPLHVRDNLQLQPGQYRLLIKGVDIAKGNLMTGHLMAMNPGNAKKEIEGIRTTEPAFGLPAVWIRKEQKEEAQLAGYTVVDLSTIIATHIAEIIKKNAADLLGRQEVQRLLDALATTSPKAVEEVTNALSLGIIQKVLQNLVRENISIRDLLSISEALADYAEMTKDPEILTEYVRQKMGRTIIKPFLDEVETLHVITMNNDTEEQIRNSLQQTEHGVFLSLDPAAVQKMINAVKHGVEEAGSKGFSPVILSNPTIRRHLRRLIERFIPNTAVLSHSEVPGNILLESVGVITLK